MSDTTNVTKQFLDKDGLNALWTKICDNFASKDDLNNLTFSDTKNTTGATNTNSKIYLVGATSQSTNPVTYSHDTAYVGSDGYLYSNSTKVDMSKLDNKADKDLTSTLILQGTDIPNNADLNTIEYLKIGIYNCKTYGTAISLKNCPVSNGFRMEVYSYQSSNTDDNVLTTAQYVYRLRKIIRLTGEQYYQYVYSTTEKGVFTYDDWQYIPTTKATIDTTDTNGSTITNGDASTPVYIDSSGKFSSCTGVYSDSKNCIPKSTLIYDLGSSTRSFSTTYTRYIDTPSGYNLRLKAAGAEHINMLGGNVNTTANIIPTTNNTYNLGSANYKWKNIYASDFIENGASISTIYADKSYADYCSSYLHSANRAQFCKPAGVTIEYSTNGGSTWIDYGATDDQKVGFFSGISQEFILGKKLSTKATASDKLRITMDATAMGFYTSCKCLLLNVSTNGSSNFNVKVEKSMKGSANTFSTLIESQTLTGWSGWNRIPIGYSFGGGDTQNYNIAKLRLTFSSDGAGSSYTSGAHAYVLDMEVLGNTYWTIPHIMAKTGHLYTWDAKGNAIFDTNVYPNKGIVFAGTDTDRNLIRITGSVNETIDSKSNFGYTLKYLGLGTGVNNALALYADNETATAQNLATKWLNDGTMYSRNILPHDNNTFNLGSTNNNWKNIYATTFTGNLVGNASTADSSVISTKTGDGTNILYVGNQNEINFGGTNNSNTIYFGYRATDSKPVPSKFVFGRTDGVNGTAELLAKTYKKTDGTEVSYNGHTHAFLNGSGVQNSALSRNLTNFPATKTLFTGGWNTSSGNYATQYGTTLDISYSTWYQRLAFNTAGRIEYFRGINSNNSDNTSASLTKIGDLAYTSDIPTTLKNPYSLTIQGNGTTLANGVYDGSASKTVNITAASIGAASADDVKGSLYKTIYAGAKETSNPGILVKTSVGATSNAMISVKITGNAYCVNGGTKPIFTVLEFYNYYNGGSSNPRIINISGTHFGADLGTIKLFNYDSKVYLWIPQTGNYQSFNVFANWTNSSGVDNNVNIVESLTKGNVPSTATYLVEFTPKLVAYDGDYTSSSGEHTHTINATSSTTEVAAKTHSHTVTATGSVSSTFTGTSATTNNNTSGATVASGGHTHTISGRVSASGQRDTTDLRVFNVSFTFSGSSVATTSTIEVAAKTHSHTVTATGSVSSTFTGTSATTNNNTSGATVASGGHTHTTSSSGSHNHTI